MEIHGSRNNGDLHLAFHDNNTVEVNESFPKPETRGASPLPRRPMSPVNFFKKEPSSNISHWHQFGKDLPPNIPHWHQGSSSAAFKKLKAEFAKKPSSVAVGEYWCTASKKPGMFAVVYIDFDGQVKKTRFPHENKEHFNSFVENRSMWTKAMLDAAAEDAIKINGQDTPHTINAKEFLSTQPDNFFVGNASTAMRLLSKSDTPGKTTTRLSGDMKNIVVAYIDVDGKPKEKMFNVEEIPEKQYIVEDGINIDARTRSNPQMFIDTIQNNGRLHLENRDAMIAAGKIVPYDSFSDVEREFSEMLKNHGFKGFFCVSNELPRTVIDPAAKQCCVRLTGLDSRDYLRLFFSTRDGGVKAVTVGRDGYVQQTEDQKRMLITQFLDKQWAHR